jgi:hypothetical protein
MPADGSCTARVDPNRISARPAFERQLKNYITCSWLRKTTGVRHQGLEIAEASDIAAWSRQACDEAATDRIADVHEHDRNGVRFLLHCLHRESSHCQNGVRCEARHVGVSSRPSAFAVFRFTARSNFVGSSTGRSAGLVPCKILCT